METKEIGEDVLTEKETQSSSGSSPQGGDPNQVRVRLRLQDQSALNWSPRTYPDSVFNNPHMVGKII